MSKEGIAKLDHNGKRIRITLPSQVNSDSTNPLKNASHAKVTIEDGKIVIESYACPVKK